MDNERILFEKGCFLPSWTEDNPVEEQVSRVYHTESKDLATLLNELSDIKKHIEDVREREWILARKIQFLNNNLAQE